MLQAKQKRAQMARKRILDAATAKFAEKGFDRVSTEEIAKEAGVSKGTVFAHFGDKLQLLAEIGATDMEAFLIVFEEATSGPSADVIDVLTNRLGDFLAYYERQPEFLRLTVEKTTFQRHEGNNRFNEIIGRLHFAIKGVIEKALDDGAIAVCDAELTAVAVRSYLLHTAVGRLCGEYDSLSAAKNELRALISVVVCQKS